MLFLLLLLLLSSCSVANAYYEFEVDFGVSYVGACDWSTQNAVAVYRVDNCTPNIQTCATVPNKRQKICVASLDDVPFPHKAVVVYEANDCQGNRQSGVVTRKNKCFSAMNGSSMSNMEDSNTTHCISKTWDFNDSCTGNPSSIQAFAKDTCLNINSTSTSLYVSC